MEWLNYHHLFYFWTVAKEGTITAACKRLRLAQPTVSTQLRTLEENLGVELFDRNGRTLVLTESGRLVYRYADEIFSLGHELLDTIKGQPTGKPIRLKVGAADVLPKLIVYHLLKPALSLSEPVHLISSEGKPEDLLTKLTTHELDVVFSDSPARPEANIRVFSHFLGECNVAMLATERLAKVYRPGFPVSLNEAPVLLPTTKTALRRSMDAWLDAKGIRPIIAAEVEDSALQKEFGRAGIGLVPIHSVIEKDVERKYGLKYVGRLPEIKERFYAISLERKIRHPAVAAILERARESFFQ